MNRTPSVARSTRFALRDVDGVHLNVAGAVIAAKLVVAALGEP